MTLPRPEHFSDWKAWAAEVIRRDQANSLAKRLSTIITPAAGIGFSYNKKLETISIESSEVLAHTHEMSDVIGLDTALDGKVDVSGDTMTGALVLNADPVVPLGAATMQYVDARVASKDTAAEIGFTPAGGVAATDVQAAIVELDSEKVAKAGDTMTGALSITPAAGTATLSLDRAAGSTRQIVYRTAGAARWVVAANNTAESGADAGSDFRIQAYDDAGVLIGDAIRVTRATRQVAIAAQGTSAAPSLAFGPSAGHAGINWTSLYTMDFVCNAISRMTLSNSGLSCNVPVSLSSSFTIGHSLAAGNAITQGGSGIALKITNQGSGDSFLVEDAASTDTTPFVVKNDGKVGVGLTTPAYQLQALQDVAISGAAASFRALRYLTDASLRFSVLVDNAAESGSNVGSDLKIRRYDDAGASLGDPLSITRSTGQVRFSTSGTVSAPTIGLGANNSGINHVGTSQIDLVCNGAARASFNTTGLTLSVPLLVSHNNVTGNSITQSGTGPALVITNQGTGDSFLVEDTGSVDATPFVIKNDGKVGIGTPTPAVPLDVVGVIQSSGDTFTLATAKTPASAAAAGTQGQICWDTNYIYVCVATNTWKRVAIATW